MSVNGKNRPGTIINWHDQIASTNVIQESIIRPLYFQLFTSDKGPETLRTVHGNEFFSLYGASPSFKKHGQPLIQAAEIIKAGGEILCKRVVAEDATLANLVVLAKVTNESVQKTDASGNALYIDADTGKETTDAAGGLNERVMVNVAKIKYEKLRPAMETGKLFREFRDNELIYLMNTKITPITGTDEVLITGDRVKFGEVDRPF